LCRKNGKIARNYGKIALKIYTEVARKFHGCFDVPNWAGFCLGKKYNNTEVVSVAVHHS